MNTTPAGVPLPSDRARMRRRWQKATLVAASIALSGALPMVAMAQPAARIGVVGPPEEPRFSEIVAGLLQGLREHGYAGAGVTILDRRVARGDQAAVRAAVADLLARRSDVLFVIGSELAHLAHEAPSTLPIVFITPGDPVAAGLVASLARPGGRLTAVTFEYPELSGKRLELLHELAPRTTRVLAIFDPRDASPRQGMEVARRAAASLGVRLLERGIRAAEDVPRVLQGARAGDAVLVIPGGLPSAHSGEIVRLANARRLPTMLHARSPSTRDALASYGASDVDVAREGARLVVKVLRGTPPGEIPVERPTRLRLVLNARTARDLSLALPASIRARADEIIE